jgi:hypothetical protein
MTPRQRQKEIPSQMRIGDRAVSEFETALLSPDDHIGALASIRDPGSERWKSANLHPANSFQRQI